MLAILDCLALNVITKDDVPALLKLLDTPEGQFNDGMFIWEDYLLDMDLEKRKEEILKDKTFIRCI